MPVSQAASSSESPNPEGARNVSATGRRSPRQRGKGSSKSNIPAENDPDMPWPWGRRPQRRFTEPLPQAVYGGALPSNTHAACAGPAPHHDCRIMPKPRLNASAKPFSPSLSHVARVRQEPPEEEPQQEPAPQAAPQEGPSQEEPAPAEPLLQEELPQQEPAPQAAPQDEEPQEEPAPQEPPQEEPEQQEPAPLEPLLEEPPQPESRQDDVVDQAAATTPSETAPVSGDSDSLGHSPLFSLPASPATVLEPAEVVALHSSDICAPVLAGAVLRYPAEFLMRFAGQCAELPMLRDVFKDLGCNERATAELMPRSRPRDDSTMRRTRTSPMPVQPMSPLDGGLWRSTSGIGRTTSGAGRSTSGMGRSTSGTGRGRAGRQPARPDVVVADVKPLVKGADRFAPKALKAGAAADESPEAFDRSVRGLLNKLTPDNFGAVSAKLQALGEQPATAAVERPMRRLIELLFAKVTDEKKWAGVYTELCVKLIQSISNSVVDSGLAQTDGSPMRGGVLVRAYLLSQCQKEFERGWTAEIPLNIESREFYEASTVKRRGLGLMHFVGELFLCDIVTANIVHACVQSLLDGASGASPDPAKAESAGVLLTVAGRKLNEPPSRARLDQYMGRVRAMIKDGGLPNPVRYGLMDVVDLQQANWVPKKVSEGPATIAEIHQAAARDQSAPRPMSMAPGTKAGAAPQRAGDLSRFGNLARSKQVGVGMAPSNPFGAFAGRMSRPRGASAPATPTAPSRVASSNAFDLLADSSDKPDREPASVAMPAPVDRAALARRVRAMIDEYLQLEAAAELVACFGALEQAGRPAAVGEMANIIVDCRLDRVEKIAAAARHLRMGSVLPEDAVVAGLAEFAAQLEDIVLDAPHALSRFGLLAAAAGVSPSRVAKVLRGLTGSGASVAAVTCAYLERLVANNGRDKTKADIARVGPGVDRLIGRADAVDATNKALGVHDLLDIFSA